MNNLMIETEVTTLGGMLGIIYKEYPKLKIHHQFAVNNVRLNTITKQPFQTVVMYMAYDLPGNEEIDQNEILDLTRAAASPVPIKSKLDINN